jgi:broad specificity phosphatase PhoE
MTRLIIWRHGNTDYNAENRVQGQTDIPLNERGHAQAAAAARLIADLAPDVIISSDLRRATETAAPLAALTGLDVKLDARLRERAFGEWQGQLISEIRERYPTEYASWRAGSPSPGSGIEPLNDLAKRVAHAFEDAATMAETVVVVTHGGAARQGCGQLLGWPLSAIRTLGSLDNCRRTELRHSATRGWQLTAHNVG